MNDTMPSLDGRRLVLRADADQASGTGHLMRSLALAQAWLDLGGGALWLLADAPPTLIARIEAEGIVVERLAAAAGSPDDAARLRAALDADPAAVAVVDGLAFGDAFVAGIGSAAGRSLLVDDMALLASYEVGWVLNQNAHADRGAYPAGSTARFLLGLRYVLLRREFRTPLEPRPVVAQARRLLVTFGGSDPSGMTLRTMHALQTLPAAIAGDLEVRVIVGSANPQVAAIEAEETRSAGIQFDVLHAVADMPAQIRWADLAVTSGGSTVWELARSGCPALVVETAAPEVFLLRGLEALDLFDRLGPEAVLDQRDLAHRIAARVEDRGWRTEMRERGMRLVDGDGARRVALELAGMTTED